jgi:hypothetical protein
MQHDMQMQQMQMQQMQHMQIQKMQLESHMLSQNRSQQEQIAMLDGLALVGNSDQTDPTDELNLIQSLSTAGFGADQNAALPPIVQAVDEPLLPLPPLPGEEEPEPEQDGGLPVAANHDGSLQLRVKVGPIKSKRNRYACLSSTKLVLYKETPPVVEGYEGGTKKAASRFGEKAVIDLMNVARVSRPRSDGSFIVFTPRMDHVQWEFVAESEEFARQWCAMLWDLTPVVSGWLKLSPRPPNYSKFWCAVARGRILWYSDPERRKGLEGEVALACVQHIVVVSKTIFEVHHTSDAGTAMCLSVKIGDEKVAAEWMGHIGAPRPIPMPKGRSDTT